MSGKSFLTYLRHPQQLLALVISALLLQGCAEVVLTGVGAAGVAAVQERSVGAALDDKVIIGRLSSDLLNRDEKLFAAVSAEVVEGRVMLTGVVKTRQLRDEVAAITWKVAGVREVLNELQVHPSGSIADYARDTWITTQLISRLVTDMEIRDVNYHIETVNKVVYLIGIAQNREESEKVILHARNVADVAKVVSHVIMKDDPRRKR